MTKNSLLTLAKVVFALALIFWLYNSGKLNFAPLRSLIKTPHLILASVFLFISQIFLGAIRWKIIVEMKSQQKLNLFSIFKVQWIGTFFSSALPGVVTGDVMKLSYIKKMDAHLNNSFLLFSILFDRILGLAGLIILAAFSSLVFYSDLMALNQNLSHIIFINMILLLGTLVFILFFYLPNTFIYKITSIFKISKDNKFLNALIHIKNQKNALFIAIFLSVISHVISVFCFHLINQSFYETPITFLNLLSVLPIGQIATALPISPAGLGVGHVAFEKLFTYFHHTNGATLFNNVWLIVVLTNLFGVVPFLLGQIKSHK
jgi:uncharacterized protein (TIRG00374 family)